jgi:hypothetical protein
MLAAMRWWISLALVVACGGGDDTSSSMHMDAGTNGDGSHDDGGHVDAPPCSGGAASMIDPTYGHCYILYTVLLNYMTAKTACEQMAGFHLARIETANEQPLIATLVGLDIAWIGGNDLGSEGAYFWDNGTMIGQTHWKTGEPDNGGGTAEEDCIGVDGAFNGGWTDRPCETTSATSVPGMYAYVCEHD